MKKNTMATAIIAGLAGVAGIANISTAVNLNPDGVGQVLLYPYYTVNDGNITALSVVNTTEDGKAVKVRFLDAMNSKEVLDFNLYLSGFDVWTAVVRQADDATGPAIIFTRDNSCTVPGIKRGLFQLPTLGDGTRYFPFRTTFFTDQSTLAGANGRAKGPTSGNARTRSGYVEMIEMGTIPNDTEFGFALTHNIGGVPNDCDALEGAWLAAGTPGGSGLWLTPGAIGVKDTIEPSGGLFGAAAIVKLAEGTFINYNAEAIDGFSAQRIHTQPGADTPNLASGNQAGGTVLTSYVFDRGRLVTSNWAIANNGSADAVSALFMREAVFNEWEVDPQLGAVSEWVVTLPTRKFFVTGSTAFRAPFTTGWSGCERYSGRIYNREERTFQILDASPSTGFTTFCREANVLWFQDRNQLSAGFSPALGEPAFLQVPTYLEAFGVVQYTFNQGWFWMGYYDLNAVNNQGIRDGLRRPVLTESAPNPLSADPRPDLFYGLPAVGFWAYKVTNLSQNAAVGNFGGAYPHRASRACFKGAFADSSPCD